jgi:hypothetical protein
MKYEVIYNQKKIIVESDIGISDAKEKGIKEFKVPKSKQGLVAIQSMTSKENEDFKYL